MPGFAVLLPLGRAEELDPRKVSWLGRRMIHEPGDKWTRLPTPGDEFALAVERPSLPERVWLSSSAEKSVTSAVVGEIYDRTGNPAATLLDSYVERGDPDFDGMDGSFSALILDGHKRTALVATDATGSRPIYFGRGGDWMCLAPEAGIVAEFARLMGGPPNAIRPDAVVSFLLHGHLLGRQTWYEEVRMLPPAHVLAVRRDGTTSEDSYFQLGPRESGRIRGTESVLKEELAKRLRRAVTKRIGSGPEKLVVPLSGGIDSRGILGCLLERSGLDLQTATWGVEDDSLDSDAAVARSLARKLGIDHHFLRRRSDRLPDDLDEMTVLLDGTTDDPAMHHHELSLMRRIRDEMNGQKLFRGDECFGFGGSAANDDEAFARVGITHLDRRPDVASLIPASVREERVAESRRALDRLSDDCPLSDPTDRKDYYYATQRLVHYLNRSSYYKLSVLCLENPWLDRDILDFIWSVKTEWRVEKKLYVRTLHDMFPELMAEPLATSTSLEDWSSILREDARLRSFVRRRLVEQADVLSPYLDPGSVAQRASMALDPDAGGHRISIRGAARGVARDILPDVVYDWVKQQFMEQALRHPLPQGTLVMRLLVLQAWLSHSRDVSASSLLLEAR